jgi:DNA polymerase-3 subunit delta'
MSWQRIRGHDLQIAAFERVVQRGRLAHAYLFVGAAGIGKRLFADELARALLCEAPDRQRLEACDRCPSCIQVAAGTHPDFFVIGRPEDKNVLPVEVVRDELCKSLSLKSARGKGKVAIIDDADYFNEESANCFLKTLEEPPPGSVLLLIGTSPSLQLPTILSRCQLIHFRPLPIADVALLLKQHGVDDAQWAEKLARLAGGSPGQAIALSDKALWEFRRILIDSLAKTPCDTIELSKQWVHFVEDAGKDASARRQRASLVVQMLIQFLQAVLAQSVGSLPEFVEPEDRRALETLANRLDTDEVAGLIDRCVDADAQIDRWVQLALVLEALTDALAARIAVPS